jgi:hypothetical protein
MIINPYIYAGSTLNTNLFGYYKAESNANDATINANNGTAIGGLTYASGKNNNAFSLNGTNAGIDVANGLWNFTGSFSFDGWFKFNDVTSVQHLFSSLVSGGSGYRGFHCYISAGKVKMYTYRDNVSQGNSTSSVTLSTGTWYHLGFSFEAGVSQYIIVNGAIDTTSAGSQIPNYYTSNQYATIGYWKDAGPSSSRFVNGLIDEVGIWNKKLTTTEWSERYASSAGKFHPF